MTFQPIVLGAGIGAWTLLNKTMTTQTKAFDADPRLARDTAYFEEKIGQVDTAEQLVTDRRLLRVALGAFGLQDDIDNRYFIQKILEGGTIQDDTLANRLTDDRYREFSKTFGFGDFDTPSTKLSDFGTKITALFRRQQFEVAVGEQDDSMRLALNADRVLAKMAGSSVSDTTKWFRIMGNPPLRQVFETGLGLPTSFSQLDIEQQLEVFRDRAEQQLGTSEIDQFSDPELREKLVQRFLTRSQVQEIQANSIGSLAVSLLENAANFARTQYRV